MGCSRRGAAAAALNGQIWVVGGWDGQAYLKAVEVYDMATARWSQVKSQESRVKSILQRPCYVARPSLASSCSASSCSAPSCSATCSATCSSRMLAYADACVG
jgi:hypothetical protein